MKKFRTFIKFILLSLALITSLNIYSFNKIFIFGDSLSDNGYLNKRIDEISENQYVNPLAPNSPIYYHSRFTNGKVWPEILAEKLNIPINSSFNYAYGGATVIQPSLVPNLSSQIQTYLYTHLTADPNGLYIVWIGINDLFQFNSYENSENLFVENIFNKIEIEIKNLINHGAKTILLPQQFDLSVSPYSLLQDKINGDTKYSNELKRLIIIYNNNIKSMTNKLSNEFIDVKFITIDFFDYLKNQELAKKYGFMYMQDSCIDVNVNNCGQFIFFDGLHPTTKVHEIIAEKVFEELSVIYK